MKTKDVIYEYIKSRRFTSLAVSSQRSYLPALDQIADLMGERPIEEVRRRDLIRAFESLSETPAVANRFGRVASILFNYATDMEYCAGNPAQRITPIKLGTWRQWTKEEVDKVIALKHPIVSVAVALAYYTAQREADVLKMQWSDIKDGVMKVKQSKTGAVLEIAIAPQLQEILDSVPKNGKYIIQSKNGLPVSGPAFRNMTKRVTRSVGVDAPFHGLRKTVGSRLAEKGRSINEIAAVLGHKTLTMAALYTKQADSKKLIASAVTSLASD